MTTLRDPALPPTLAEQDEEQLGGRLSVLQRQKRDHIRLEELLTELSVTPAHEQRPVLRAMYRLVFPHAFAEESVLWPVIRQVLPEGEQLTLEVEQEHQEVNELVSRLEELNVDDVERERLLDRLMLVLRADVRDEEDELLPRLQREVDAATLRRLGVLWEVVRRVAPTRPHPVVARRPPGNVIAALPLTLIDRTRDNLERLLPHAPRAGRRVLAAGDDGLRHLAGLVERLPPMRSGEDRSTHSAG